MVQADAHAFWMRAPGVGEIRPVTLPAPGEGDVMVRTLRSGVSRGTETLVFRGGVPPDQYAVMRAPFQEGDFPAPVKYGYLNVGAVEEGPAELRGRMVFCLYPHQTAYVVPAGAVTVVPGGDPHDSGVWGTVETARRRTVGHGAVDRYGGVCCRRSRNRRLLRGAILCPTFLVMEFRALRRCQPRRVRR